MANPSLVSSTDLFGSLSVEDQDRLLDLIDEYELAQEDGIELTPEDLCRHSPHLLVPFKTALEKLATVQAELETPDSRKPPERLGQFRVVEQIGVGGSGVVFRCLQEEPSREVAVKVFKPVLDPTEQERRFRQEIGIAGQLSSKSIPQVYLTGVSEWNGTRCFWIAMELIDGSAIHHYVESHDLSSSEILSLFRDACRTVQAAHRQGIIHRDLKPSNICVSREGLVHVLDFGIAVINRGGAQSETNSETDQSIGTGIWVAPEVVQGGVPDTRSDIYSLGMILFQLLSGQSTAEMSELGNTPLSRSLLRARVNRPLLSKPSFTHDLNVFLGTLLAVDPARRYQNLDHVLEDLDRLIEGRPVSVRTVPALERLQLWSLRNKLLAGSWLMLVVSVLGLFAATGVAFLKSKETAELAEEKSVMLSRHAAQLEVELEKQKRLMAATLMRRLQSEVERAPQLVKEQLDDEEHFPNTYRGFAWHLLRRLSKRGIRELPSVDSRVLNVALNPAETLVAIVHYPNQLSIQELETGTITAVPIQANRRSSPVWSHDGRSLLVLTKDQTIIQVDTDSADIVQEIKLDGGLEGEFALTPDDQTLVCNNRKKELVFYDIAEGRAEVLEFERKLPLAHARFDDNSCFLITKTGESITIDWNRKQVMRNQSLHDKTYGLETARFGDQIDGLMYGPAIVLGESNGDIHVIHHDPNARNLRFQVQETPLRGLEFFGQRKMALLNTSGITLHDAYTTHIPPIHVDIESEQASAFTAFDDGNSLLIGCRDGSLLTYDTRMPPSYVGLFTPFQGWKDQGYGEPVTACFLGQTNRVVIGHQGGWLANVARGGNEEETLEAFAPTSGRITSLAFAAESRLLACGVGGDKPSLIVMQADGNGRFLSENGSADKSKANRVAKIPTPAGVRDVLFVPEIHSLFAGLRNGELLRIDMDTWKVTSQRSIMDRGIFGLDFLNGFLVAGGHDGWIRMVNPETGQIERKWRAHSQRITSLCSHEGTRRIFSVSHDGDVAIWSVEGEEIARMSNHLSHVRSVAVSPDGQTLASGGDDRRVLIWDAKLGALQLEIGRRGNRIVSLEFDETGKQLLGCSLDTTTNIWGSEVPSGHRSRVLPAETAPVRSPR